MASKRKSEVEAFENSAKPFLTDELVTINLDEEPATSFKVSKALLYHASPYFVKALTGGFQESRERRLKLPGCDAETFNLFLAFLVNGQLPDYEAELIAVVDESTSDVFVEVEAHTTLQKQLIKLWSFADAYVMPKLQNAVMRRLIPLSRHHYFSVENVLLAWNSNSRTSMLVGMIIGELAGTCIYDGYDQFSEEWYNTMGGVDGFFHDFNATLLSCTAQRCRHAMLAMSCRPSAESESSEWMVPED